MKPVRKAALLSAVAALSLVPTVASAAEAIWVGLSPGGGSFSDPFNWNVFFVAGAGDRATFSTVNPLSQNPLFGTGTTTINQLLISDTISGWTFAGIGGGENLRVLSDVTLQALGIASPFLTTNGLDVFADVTNITNNTKLTVGGSSSYNSDINMSGNGSFTVNAGNTLRGRIDHQSTATSFVSGLLDTSASQIISGGVLGIGNTGHIFLNGGVHTVSNGILGFNASSSTMSFNSGAELRVSNTGLVDFLGSHEFENGAAIRVTSGGRVVGASFLDLGISGTGSVSVDGAGSSFAAPNNSFWGGGTNGVATVTFSNSGVGTLASLDIAQSSGSRGDVQLLSGGQLTTTSGLRVGPGSGTSSLARITVNGGNLNSNTTSIFRNGGQLVMSAGSVNFAGDATFATGSTFNMSGGNVNLTAGRTLNIAGGIVNRTAGGFSSLPNGSTLRITGGGQFTTNSFFDIANGASTGTMLVDGAGSRFNSTASTTDWGQSAGNFATITFSNGGVGTYSTGLQISDNGGRSLVNLNSNGQLNAAGLVVGGTASAATINIAGGTLNTLNAAQFNNGALVNLTTGGLLLNGNTTFNTGATLNNTGGALNLAVNQTLAFNGGVGSISGSFAQPNGTTIRVTNNAGTGGQLHLTSFLDIANGNATGTLLVDGANSRITTGGGVASDWGFSAGNTATATFSNGGAGTFNGLDLSNGGGTTQLTIASGGNLTVNNFLDSGGTGSTVNINISGGSLNSINSAAFRNGSNVNVTGNGVLRLGGNSTFSTGATLNYASTNAIDLPTAGTTVAFDGGVGTYSTGVYTLDNGQSLRVTNGGRLTLSDRIRIAPFNSVGTLLVDGPGSIVETLNPVTSSSSMAANPGTTAALTISNGGAATFASGMQFAASGVATINVQSGGLLQTSGFFTTAGVTPGTGTGTINVNGGTLRTTGNSNVNGGATLNYAAGTVNIGGTLGVGDIGAGARVLLTPGGNKVLRVGGLNIPAVNNGKVDLSDNDMIIDYTGASPLGTIRGFLNTGRNGGNWLGNGLTSSTAALNSRAALGLVEATQLGSPATFFGQPIDNTTLLTRYTLYGDGDLNGTVNITDFAFLAANFNVATNSWFLGDYNYDGTTNISDFALLASNFNLSLPTDLPVLSAVEGPRGSAVPEPTCGVAALAMSLLLAPRSRKRRNRIF